MNKRLLTAAKKSLLPFGTATLFSPSLLSSYGQNTKDLIGIYKIGNNADDSFDILNIKTDGTFDLTKKSFFSQNKYNGKWILKNDTIILNTHKQPRLSKGFTIIQSPQKATNTKIYAFTLDSTQIDFF